MSDQALQIAEGRWRIVGPEHTKDGFAWHDRVTVERDGEYVALTCVDESDFPRNKPACIRLDGFGAHELTAVLVAVADARHVIERHTVDPVMVSGFALKVVLDHFAGTVPDDATRFEMVDGNRLHGAVAALREVLA